MKSEDALKQLVQKKYSEIALQDKEINQSSCCGSGCCSTEVYSIMSEDYSALPGYQSQADLGLGCGLPTLSALIKAGDTVIDLGSGAGNDCFVARAETGISGQVIGIDFTEAMIQKARANALQLGFSNVSFRLGDIEKMPLSSNIADVVLSNCVLNLVPDKDRVFNEIYRVLKPGGHFSISDVVLLGNLPDGLRKDAEMYAGCIAGAIRKDEYLAIIGDKGFRNIRVQKEKPLHIPQDILLNYLNLEELALFSSGSGGILSITVYAEKPADSSCCAPGCCD